jgi:hypothetical protein
MKILTTRARLPVTLPLNRVRTHSTASHLLRRKLGTRWNASLPGLGPQGALRFRGILCLLVLVLAGQVAVARAPATGTPTSINTAFVKLFGAAGAFTAKVDTVVLDPYQQEKVRLLMDFAASEGKVRIEINLAQMKSRDLPPSKVTELKESGMERIVSLFRPDKKVTYIVYPGTQSYLSMPLAKEDIDAFEKGLNVDKTALGKETLDGHDCMKNKVVVKDSQGPVLQAVTWNAADFKDFPLQIELKEKGNTVRMHFTQLRFTKPDPQQFDVPAAYGLMK